MNVGNSEGIERLVCSTDVLRIVGKGKTVRDNSLVLLKEREKEEKREKLVYKTTTTYPGRVKYGRFDRAVVIVS